MPLYCSPLTVRRYSELRWLFLRYLICELACIVGWSIDRSAVPMLSDSIPYRCCCHSVVADWWNIIATCNKCKKQNACLVASVRFFFLNSMNSGQLLTGFYIQGEAVIGLTESSRFSYSDWQRTNMGSPEGFFAERLWSPLVWRPVRTGGYFGSPRREADGWLESNAKVKVAWWGICFLTPLCGLTINLLAPELFLFNFSTPCI